MSKAYNLVLRNVSVMSEVVKEQLFSSLDLSSIIASTIDGINAQNPVLKEKIIQGIIQQRNKAPINSQPFYASFLNQVRESSKDNSGLLLKAVANSTIQELGSVKISVGLVESLVPAAIKENDITLEGFQDVISFYRVNPRLVIDNEQEVLDYLKAVFFNSTSVGFVEVLTEFVLKSDISAEYNSKFLKELLSYLPKAITDEKSFAMALKLVILLEVADEFLVPEKAKFQGELLSLFFNVITNMPPEQAVTIFDQLPKSYKLSINNRILELSAHSKSTGSGKVKVNKFEMYLDVLKVE